MLGRYPPVGWYYATQPLICTSFNSVLIIINEFKHLKFLQDKINSYLEFIETKQYEEIYPKEEFQLSNIEELHLTCATICVWIEKTYRSYMEEIQFSVENFNEQMLIKQGYLFTRYRLYK